MTQPNAAVHISFPHPKLNWNCAYEYDRVPTRDDPAVKLFLSDPDLDGADAEDLWEFLARLIPETISIKLNEQPDMDVDKQVALLCDAIMAVSPYPFITVTFYRFSGHDPWEVKIEQTTHAEIVARCV